MMAHAAGAQKYAAKAQNALKRDNHLYNLLSVYTGVGNRSIYPRLN